MATRTELHDAAGELLEELYVAGRNRHGREQAAVEELRALAEGAAAEDAGLEAATGAWQVVPETGEPSGGACVVRGDFELHVPDAGAAGRIAALLNWCEVPEPGAQT